MLSRCAFSISSFVRSSASKFGQRILHQDRLSSQRFASSSPVYTESAPYEDRKTEFFTLSNGDKLAFKRTPGKRAPGIIYIPGFMANMTGQKAQILERYCKLYDHPFVRFDFRTVGESTGDFSAITLHEWLDDIVFVLDNLTEASVPQILVGSSFGALLQMPVALKRPERVFGLVGIATPHDEFAQFIETLSKEDKEMLESGKGLLVPWSEKPISKGFVDSTMQLIKENVRVKSLAINCPVRFLHGLNDKVVSFRSAQKTANLMQSDDVQVILAKSSDHRFSTPYDLQIIVNTVDQMIRVHEYPYAV